MDLITGATLDPPACVDSRSPLTVLRVTIPGGQQRLHVPRRLFEGEGHVARQLPEDLRDRRVPACVVRVIVVAALAYEVLYLRPRCDARFLVGAREDR